MAWVGYLQLNRPVSQIDWFKIMIYSGVWGAGPVGSPNDGYIILKGKTYGQDSGGAGLSVVCAVDLDAFALCRWSTEI